MAIDNLTSLTPNKQNYPDIVPPADPTYYFSAEEYNKLLRTLQILIDDYNLKVSMIGQSSNLPIVTSSDTITTPTDANIFSAARTLQEIMAVLSEYDSRYLSKVNDDTAEGTIRFNKGIQLGDYQNGFRGGIINQNADAELKSLKLREWLEVPELRFNRIEVYMGDKWRAPGGGIIESVDTVNQIITLKLEPGEYGAVSQNDLCMGIFHSIISSNNSTSSTDDSRNNRTIKGFATSYFKVEQLLNPQENNSRFRYSLRPISARHTKQVHPEPYMNFAAFGNTTNPDRQSSAYETRTYQRFLVDMNDWECTQLNVAAQFGDLSNLNTLGLSGVTGYSIYLNNVYFTGTIQQMKAPKIEFGTWWTWNGTKWVDSGVPAVIQPKDGLYATLINESLAVGRTDTNYLHTWAELHVFEGDRELIYNKIEANQRGTYTVSLVPTNIIPGDLVQTTLNGKTFLRTTPIMGIDENVNSGSILFRIRGIRLDGANFEFSTSQTFVKADSGLDGISTEYIYTRTTTNAAPLKPASDNVDQFVPTNWTLDPVGVTPTLKFEWVARRQKIAGIWSAWGTPSPWARYVADGIDGKDGTDIEYIFIRNNDQTFSDESNRPPTSQTDDYVPTGWTDNPVGPTPTLQFEWVSKREKTGGAGGTGGIWGTFSIPALYSRYARDGNDGVDGTNGVDAITLILSNESHIFAGSQTTALNGSITTNVISFKGGASITPTSITVGAKPTGMTSSVSGTVITFTVTTAMVSASGIVPITVVVDGKTMTINFSYSIGFKGAAGENGKTISINGDTQIIKITNGVRQPNTNFSITGNASNTTITTWTYSVNGGAFSATVPTGLSRSSNVVTVNPLNVTANTISIKASDGTIYDTFTIAVVSDGSQGPPGTGVPIVFRGDYVSINRYYGSSIRQDVVKYNNIYYIAKQTASPDNTGFVGITPTTTTTWDNFGASFTSVATELLLAEKANIASFAFIDQKMISQSGVNAEGAQLNLGVDNTPPVGFIPNLKLDGNLGEIIAGAGKIKFNKDGSGYLANNNLFWNEAGDLTINGQLFTGTQTGGLYTNEIKSDGSGRLGGGKIKWYTDGSGYIGNNSELTGLRWDTSGNVYIGKLKITDYGISIGSTSDSGTWTPYSYNLVMYPEYSLFRQVGSDTKFVREASINLDRSFAGIAGRDAVAIYNHLRTTEQGGVWLPGDPPRNLWQTNKALILSARHADINLALNVLSGFVYLNDVRTSGSLNLANKGYVRTTTMNGFKVLILEDSDPPINRDIPGPDGLYWNSEQAADVTYYGSCQYPTGYGTIHRGIVGANKVSSTISYADANTNAYNIAYNLAEQDKDQNGGCTDLDNDVHVIYY